MYRHSVSLQCRWAFFHCRAGGCIGICDFRPKLCWAFANQIAHMSGSSLLTVCAGYMSNSRSLAASFPSLSFFFSPPYYSPTFSFCFFVLNFIIYFGCSGSSLWHMGPSWLWVGWVVVCGILFPWQLIESISPAWEHGALSTAPPGMSFILLFWSSVQFSHSVSVMSDFATPWTAAHQASLFITDSQSLLTEHVHWVRDAIQPSHPLLSPSPPAFNLSQHQGLFKWVPFLLPIQFSSVNFVPVTIFWGMVGYLGEWNGKITFFS